MDFSHLEEIYCRRRCGNGRFLTTLLLALACTLSPAILRSQPVINTLAGYSGQGYADEVATNAQFFQPLGAAVDGAGNIFVADTANHTIRKMTSSGTVTTFAGLAGVSGTNNGMAGDARFNQPQGVGVDSAGNVYVGDTGNNTVRKITPAGAVSTLAGTAGVAGTNNGSGSGALFSQPAGIAVDSGGNVYVADYGNSTIRKITSSGVVSTFAGSPGNYGTNNGSGGAAQFYLPQGVAVDSSGNVYVADSANHAIRKVTSGGAVSTLAGSPGNFGTNNGSGSSALFYQPAGVAVDTNGNVYVADTFNHTIRQITPGGTVSTIAGLAGTFGSADGIDGSARFYQPAALAVHGTVLIVSDSGNGTIRTVTPSGPDWITSTLAGSPSQGSTDGSGSNSRFFSPAAIAIDASTNIYIADAQNGTIRKLSSSGAATTLCGLAGNYGSTNGSGSNARFSAPQGIAVDNAGFIYVADTGNGTIRKITPAGSVSTFAGTAGNPGIADGTGGAAQFNQPQGIAVDPSGTVYVADTCNHTIRQITPGGIVTTFAGLAGSPGSVDGTNSAARFNSPAGLGTDSSGNVYVADCFNHTVRRLTPAGLVTTLAGLSGVWGATDGTNSGARFCRPTGLALNAAGNNYVAHSGNQTIREVSPNGTNWVVTTVAGMADITGSADRLAPAAQFNYPAGVAFDSAGYLYVADAGNNAIRINKLLPPAVQLLVVQNKHVLSWPLSAPGILPETSTSVAPGSSWTVLADPISTHGQNYVLTNSAPAPVSFYRLHKP